jgi:hypothetical protein
LQLHLVVGGGIHEVITLIVVVEILHLLLFQGDALDNVFGAELLFGHRAVLDVAHLDAHEAAEVAGRHVLAVENPKQLVVDLDDHAFAELRCEEVVCHKAFVIS